MPTPEGQSPHAAEWTFASESVTAPFTPTTATQLTYSNLFLLTAENNRVYDFYRGLDASYKPSYAYSDDLGQTWRSGNIVINVPSTGTLQRPYARYVSNGTDTVHITYTEAHPRDYDNSIYHVYYKGGTLYRSDGTAIHPLTQGLTTPDEGTRIFRGDANNVAWTVDVVLDPANARPHVVYSVQVGSAGLPTGQGGDDMRYRYARWDGSAWRDRAARFSPGAASFDMVITGAAKGLAIGAMRLGAFNPKNCKDNDVTRW